LKFGINTIATYKPNRIVKFLMMVNILSNNIIFGASMKKTHTIFTLCIILPAILFGQENQLLRDLPKNWRGGANGGVSYLAFELKKNFNQATMDMNSQPNASVSLFTYKRFDKHLEVGVEFEKCYFKGYKDYSANVNWLVYDQLFNNEESKFLKTPVYYNTDISTWYLNINYNFLNIYSWERNFLNMNFFLKAGFGFSLIGVELGYKDSLDYALSNLEKPLFEKGQGRQPKRDAYGTFHAGFGFNYYISSRLSLTVESDFLFVSADYLDGVHNFEVTTNNNGTIKYTRIGVFDTVGEIKLGVSYHFDLYRIRFNKRIANNEQFKNEFFLDKKYNRIIKPSNPYSNEDLEKTLKQRKGKWKKVLK